MGMESLEIGVGEIPDAKAVFRGSDISSSSLL